MPAGIARERELLADLRDLADQVIDTSQLNVHDLKRLVMARFGESGASVPSLTVISFGYRYGVPPQADLVFDLRFLPNPYFVPELKPLTGEDPQVARYVLERSETQEFLDRIVDLAQFLFPRYQREGKAYLTVALGCTGGKHRSVAVAAALAQRLGAGGAGRPAPAPGHREGVRPSRQAQPTRSEEALLQACYWCRRSSAEGRSNPGVSLDAGWPTPDLRLICEVAREDPVGWTCRMVAAHGGVGVGAAADCREVSSWSGSWSQPMVVWRRSSWRPPNKSWELCPRWRR